MKLTKEQVEERKLEKLLPLAKSVLLEIWSNPGKYSNQNSLAEHFDVSLTTMRNAMCVTLDHAVPFGYWVESRPYRVVTKTPSETFALKLGFLERDLRSIQRTGKSFNLEDNPELVELSELIGHAAGVVKGVLAALRADVETADRELRELGDDD